MKKQTAKEIIEKLSGIFESKPALLFTTPFELLIAVILSAQCTDERVNKVTRALFKEYNTPEKMLTLKQEQLEKYIFSCGLYCCPIPPFIYGRYGNFLSGYARNLFG